MIELEVGKQFRFEASHVLPKHPGKCARLHGHSWVLGVRVRGPIDRETGFVVDYAKLSELVKLHVVDVLDHRHLGQGDMWVAHTLLPDKQHEAVWGPDFYPSSENLVLAIFRVLQPLVLELAPNISLSEVRLNETCTSECFWRAK
jgi:6-pyruvoyltetrahydropterin/6-carboxytetrahydropterin synthase